MGQVVFTLTTRIWQLAAINLTGLALTLAGLGLFGAAPALAATLWATARLDSLTAGQLARGMWREWHGEFVTANAAALPPLLVVFGSLALALVLPMIASVVLMPIAVIAAGFALAALCAVSRLSGTAADALANARTGFALAPLRHVVLPMTAPFLVWVASQQPLLALYFGLSVPCFLVHRMLEGALAPAMPSHRETAA